MVCQQSPTGLGDLGGEMAYDLRQTYAKIVGDHLEDIAQARKADNYAIYYKTLRDLKVVVKHKFKKTKVDGKVVDDEKTFDEMVKKAVGLANEHPQVWLKQKKDPIPCSQIEEALNQIEMFLYSKIEAAGMFGGNKQIQGL